VTAEQRRTYQREWYHRNLERARAQNRIRARRLRPGTKEKRSAYNRDWRERNQESLKVRERARYLREREAVKARKYGITIEEVQRLERVTHCEACGNALAKPCIDHDHETGAVRGVLCHLCNRTLGLFGDNAERLTKLVQYAVERCGPSSRKSRSGSATTSSPRGKRR
jgi:hypothetical protein